MMRNLFQHWDELSDEAHERCERVVHEFEKSWTATNRLPFSADLSGNSLERLATLIEIVCVDMEFAFNANLPSNLEAFLDGYPELRSDPTILTSLIAHEFGLREDLGFEPGIEEYRRRFPDVLDLDEILRSAMDSHSTHAEFPISPSTRYELVRLHGKGGIGEVFLAADTLLDRPVALKRLKPEYADNPWCRRRFVNEARLTSRLEYPGVVPVYEILEDSGSSLWYAMRFIVGPTLQERVLSFYSRRKTMLDAEADKLAFRDMIKRIIDICLTIHHAHSRNILHRDIKPSNVVLGQLGETVLLDWGLAVAERLHDPMEFTESEFLPPINSSLMSEGSRSGTPGFMAPEQYTGLPAGETTRTDVYAIGATLYMVLTGRISVETSDLKTAERLVLQGDFPRPAELNRRSPRPLEAICLKAMSVTPADRYSSALEVAQDLERWLADEAVSAYPEPFQAKVGRWAKRNQTAVAGIAASLFIAALGLTGIAAVQIKANNDLEVKNNALTVQRQRAEDNEDAAIDSVKKFRDVIVTEHELMNTTALESLRTRLLSQPLDFFASLRRRLSDANDTRPESLSRLAEAIIELGYMKNEVGIQVEALDAFREALPILEKLVAENPSVSKYQVDMAACHIKIAALLRVTGKLEDALQANERAIGVLDKVIRDFPNDKTGLAELANAHNNVGVIYHSMGRSEDSISSHNRALKIRQKLANASTIETGTESRSDLADSYNNLAAVLSAMGKTPESLQHFRTAWAIRKELVDAQPDRLQFLSELGDIQNNIGATLLAIGRIDEGLRAMTDSRDIRQKLTEKVPPSIRYRNALAQSHYNLGNLLAATSQNQEALKSYESARTLFESLSEQNRSILSFKSNLGATHYNIANILRKIARNEEALISYQLSISMRTELAEHEMLKSNTETQIALADSYNNLATLLGELGQTEEFLKYIHMNIAIRENQVRQHPDSTFHLSALSMALNNLGIFHKEERRFEEAMTLFRRARDINRQVLESDPRNSEYRERLALNLKQLMNIASELGDAKELSLLRADLDTLMKSDPEMIALQGRLEELLQKQQPPRDNAERIELAQKAHKMGLYSAATKLWADAIEADPAITTNRETQIAYNAACAAVLASANQGLDHPPLDDGTKKRLREQALDWLKAELATWTKFAATKSSNSAAVTLVSLKNWLIDSDLAHVRVGNSLEELPQDERKQWTRLWEGVQELISKIVSIEDGSEKK